ncbi:MurT ligase domain-containing protein [Brooklawnia cerclae]
MPQCHAPVPTSKVCHNGLVAPAVSQTPQPLTLARQALAFGLGNAAAFASRVTGRGTGASIKGAIMMKIDPGLFRRLLAGKRIGVVSGTNGKTTTTHLLTAALRESVHDPRDVVTNPDGANLREGVVSALSTRPKAPIAILEVDEQVVPDMIRYGHPEVLIMLNFSRDQLDRHHEINALGRKWREALLAAGDQGPVVVANTKDPLVVWAASAAHRAVWIDMGTGWAQDAALCPNCGAVLTHDADQNWDCPGCELTEMPPDYRVDGGDVVRADGERQELGLKVPGRFNRGNAVCALAAAVEMGVYEPVALHGMRTVEAPAGRFAIGTYASAGARPTKARLVLAKNPAGWAESLLVMESDPVVLAVDSAIADGTDVSWMWDVEYERLRGRRVIATGPRASDLAVRLSYAEVDHEVIPDMAEALKGPFDSTVDVLSTYSAFLRLCRMGGVELK